MNLLGRVGEVRRLPAAWRTPLGRGYILLAAMSAAFGLSQFTSQAVTTNYFENVLHFTGPQFGYMTAIREVPGFLLIFITALLYRMSQQRLTALALVVLGVGLGGFVLATSFWTVIPWLLISSLGFHIVLQTQYSLGMNLAEETKSGRVLGIMAGIVQAGALVGTAAVLLVFLAWPHAYHAVYLVCGFIALLGAAAIVGFPHLHEGKPIEAQLPRQRIVFTRDYRYYYLLNLLDGARQQLFFSFGLWVLVSRFGLGVSAVSLVVIVSTVVAMLFSPWAGRMIDRHGERRTLSAINVAYIVALGGYALMNNVVARVPVLRDLRLHLAVLGDRGGHVPAQDRRPRGHRPEPGDGSDPAARHGDRGAGGGRNDPQLRRLSGAVLHRLRLRLRRRAGHAAAGSCEAAFRRSCGDGRRGRQRCDFMYSSATSANGGPDGRRETAWQRR